MAVTEAFNSYCYQTQARQAGLQIDLSSDEQSHCRAMEQHLVELANQTPDGWLDFASLMQALLYAPKLGYYRSGATKVGATGDFVTAPELSPLFSRALAHQVAELMAQTGKALLELGAGSGRLMLDLLRQLEADEQLPERVFILEISAELQQRQQKLLQKELPHLYSRCVWLKQWPENFCGVILGNEVIDALPAQRFAIINGEPLRLGLQAEPEKSLCEWSWQTRAADDELSHWFDGLPNSLRQRLLSDSCDGYVSEFRPLLRPWLQGMAAACDRCAVLLIDYGYPQQEFYLPERRTGTLRCYCRQQAHEDPRLLPGLQDVSVHVDFTQLADDAHRAGFSVAGYTTQAEFLLANGVLELATHVGDSPVQQAAVSQQLQHLLLPGAMGDAIQVMLLRKGNGPAVTPETFGKDLRHRL